MSLSVGGAILGSAIIGGGAALINNFINRRNHEREASRLEGREDNAVQRRAADLRLAGLSQTLAAGSAAESHKMNPFERKSAVESAMMTAQLAQMHADISKTASENENISLQNTRDKVMNQLDIEAARDLNNFNKSHYQQIDRMMTAQISEIEARLPHIQGQERATLNRQLEEINQMRHNLAYARDHKLPVGVALSSQNFVFNLLGNALNSIGRHDVGSSVNLPRNLNLLNPTGYAGRDAGTLPRFD